jgi:TetR/AcrR family transcriptional regulator, cholesterol catabolism regulator
MPSRKSPDFDAKLDGILRQAASVFRERGYHRASIRDISRATGVSLSGLYYYFSSKEQLLYLIQRHAFETLLAEARRTLASIDNPEERLRAFVALHLGYFIEHPSEMKVLTHEETALGDTWRHEVHAIKRNYYRLGCDLVERLRRAGQLKGLETRLAVLSLFGMMNWIYTWYNPKVDPDAPTMAREMSDLFLHGILGPRSNRPRANGTRRDTVGTNGTHRSGRVPGRSRTNGSARRNSPRLQV